MFLYNVDQSRFPNREFFIGEMVVVLPRGDWITLVNSEKVSKLVLEAGGDWSQYVKAAVLRLQKKFSNVKLLGIDLVVNGNIPIAAGLSSSSALIVGTAEAMVAVNRLDTFPAQFIDFCGQGEWFEGTRGGSAYHAAIKLGQRGKVVKVAFLEFSVQDIVPFPDDYVLALCDSGIKAQKTANARDQFNHRVACYRIGLKLIKKIFTHKPPQGGLYPIRGVVLYGLAEYERSRLFADALKKNQPAEIGRLMNISHDGDRVTRFTAEGEYRI